jgi:hypothetical protein
VPTGFDVRKLPLDLSDPVAFYLRGGEQVSIHAASEDDELLTVQGPPGRSYRANIDGKTVAANEAAKVFEGTYTVTVVNN